jgi:hypothetical protein
MGPMVHDSIRQVARRRRQRRDEVVTCDLCLSQDRAQVGLRPTSV